jgi:ribosomal protein L7/L12
MSGAEGLAVFSVSLIAMYAVVSALGRRSPQPDPRLAVIERKLQLIMDHLEIIDTDPVAAEVLALTAQGQRIKAIKLYRERTGAGLREAKEAVDRIVRDNGID